MNQKDFYNYFYKYMTENERNRFNEKLKSFITAVKINSDKEFVEEAIQYLCKDYPFFKNFIDDIKAKSEA